MALANKILYKHDSLIKTNGYFIDLHSPVVCEVKKTHNEHGEYWVVKLNNGRVTIFLDDLMQLLSPLMLAKIRDLEGE